MKLKLPFEITKLFDIKLNPETGEKEISLKREYAYPIEENFKAIKKNINVNLGAGWQNWTPTYSANKDMTFTSVNTIWAKYFRIGKTIFFWLWFNGTTGGVADTILYFTYPVEPMFWTPAGMEFPCCIHELGTNYNGKYFNDIIEPVAKMGVMHIDERNWGLGAGRGAQIQGFYEID